MKIKARLHFGWKDAGRLMVAGVSLYLISLLLSPSFGYSAEKTYTRSELQDMVVSTALSYYNNTDYTQYRTNSTFWSLTRADGSSIGGSASTFRYNSFNIAPEELSRTNMFYADCSGFAALTYLYSVGYDFSEYFKDGGAVLGNFPNYYDNNDGAIYLLNDAPAVEHYRNAYKYYGRGFGTALFTDISKLNDNQNVYYTHVSEYDDNQTYVYDGKRYINKATLTQVLDELFELLQPGDIINTNRHTMVYIGDALSGNPDEVGVIHDSMNSGAGSWNPQAIRYYTKDQVYQYQFYDRIIDEIAVIRPLNRLCDGDNCVVTGIDENAAARNSLRGVSIEQYAERINDDNVPSLSRFNSVNVGDDIKYTLLLDNRTGEYKYCSKNLNLAGCSETDIVTKQSPVKIYSNVTVKAKIPNGATLQSSSDGCINENGVVTCRNMTLAPGAHTIEITLKVSDRSMKFAGFEVDYNDTSINMGEVPVLINPTLDYSFNQFDAALANYSADAALFPQKIYQDNFGLELDLSADNIINSLFESHTNVKYHGSTINTRPYYTRKKNDQNSALAQMLVPGLYGGNMLQGNDFKNRVNFMRTYSLADQILGGKSCDSDLNYGDILVTFDDVSDYSSVSRYVYAGCTPENGHILYRSTGEVINKLAGDDSLEVIQNLFERTEDGGSALFVVLRPSMVMTTVGFDAMGGVTIDPLLVVGGKYAKIDMVNPTKEAYEVKFVVDGKDYKTEKASNAFSGWYLDQAYKGNKLEVNTSVANKNDHTVYAKWTTSSIVAPVVKKDGYRFIGWFNEDMKIVSSGEQYTPAGNITLVAKFQKDTPDTPDTPDAPDAPNAPDATGGEQSELDVPNTGYVSNGDGSALASFVVFFSIVLSVLGVVVRLVSKGQSSIK